ncbi:MAG: DsrE family protein [Chlamydiae bacterium]|nr:DsrE family protein [Chlamydiota bacterium]MBI3267225.1 DsrE family protein [Chlamydiota bacterium]
MSFRKLAIILQHATYEKWHLTATLSATTTALNGEVQIFLAQEALLSFVEKRLHEASPSFQSEVLNQKYRQWLEDGKLPKAEDLFKKAKELGPVKFYGCSESVQLFRLTQDQTKNLDGVIGYTTFLSQARDAKLLVI